MPLRLVTDAEAAAAGFVGPAFQQRRRVLRDTLHAFEPYKFPTAFHDVASRNLERWKRAAPPRSACFAMLDMANAYGPGGAYREGAPAQEENLFRRTDCHFQATTTNWAPAARPTHRR